MYLFDPISLEWTQIKPDDVFGSLPSARDSFGFTSANGNLYIHGGNSQAGMSSWLSCYLKRQHTNIHPELYFQPSY